MNLRSCVVVIGLFVLFFILSAGSSVGLAQQDPGPQAQQMMTPVSGTGGLSTQIVEDVKKKFMRDLYFNQYEAVAGDLSLCGDDDHCLSSVKRIKFFLCAAKLCDGAQESKDPITCFDDIFDSVSIEAKEEISAAICVWIKGPDIKTRGILIDRVRKANLELEEANLVKNEAYVLALKGSAAACENTIKNYVGAYGPLWDYKWYKVLSGCRILAHASTREQEEGDFSTWFDVLQGRGSCLDIVNSELRQACNAPAAASPISPGYIKMLANGK